MTKEKLIVGSLSQITADTTKTRVIPTQITDFTNFGLRLRYISFLLNAPNMATWAAAVGQYIEVSVTSDTSNLDLTWGFAVRQGVGAAMLPIVERWNAPEGFPILVDKSVTVKIRSANTGAINVVTYKIFYEQVDLEDLAIAQLNEVIFI